MELNPCGDHGISFRSTQAAPAWDDEGIRSWSGQKGVWRPEREAGFHRKTVAVAAPFQVSRRSFFVPGRQRTFTEPPAYNIGEVRLFQTS
jgi:hypothetical protein